MEGKCQTGVSEESESDALHGVSSCGATSRVWVVLSV